MLHRVSCLDIVGDKKNKKKKRCLLKRGVGWMWGAGVVTKHNLEKPCNPTLGDSGISQKSAVSIHSPCGNGQVKHHRLNPGKMEGKEEKTEEESSERREQERKPGEGILKA